MHTNGFHRLTIFFCGCSHDPQSRTYLNQLLRARLFPATSESPRSAFTFQSLDLLCQLSAQGKLSAYNFYSSMRNLTDCLDIMGWSRKYEELSHVLRRYKHLLMLKRAGRGHDSAGIDATKLGEVAVECPACPLPGKNLPDDWKTLALKEP